MKINTKWGFPNNKIKLVLLVLLMSPWIAACGIRYPVTGQVVDAGSGKPVEGAVVAIKWIRYKFFGIPGLPAPKAYYGTTEDITDGQGRFKIPNYPFADHYMAVYKKEYICWASDTIFNPKGKDWKEMFLSRYGHKVKRNMVVKLEPKGENFPTVKHASFTLRVEGRFMGPSSLFFKAVKEEEKIYDNFIIERDKKGK